MDERENVESRKSIIYYPDGSKRTGESAVLKEHELTVKIHEQPVLRLICTKDRLRELVTGRLFTGGIIDGAEDISETGFDQSEREAAVLLREDMNPELNLLREEKSFRTGNDSFRSFKKRRELKKITISSYEPEWIFNLAESFAGSGGLHAKTQGTHSCLLARRDEILFSCEDIGRHNTVDKAVGYALLNKLSLKDCMLYTSGRVPTDMVEKVIASGIPVVVSKSVPTADSISMAEEYGLRLICRAHRDSFEVMT